MEKEYYIYLVKIEATGDAQESYSEKEYANNTYVVVNTRFGIDLGKIISPATDSNKKYTPGCTEICGANNMTTLPRCEEYEFCRTRELEKEENEQQKHKPGKFVKKLLTEGDLEDYKEIKRAATAEDLIIEQSNKQREEEAARLCKEKIKFRHLDMKLVSVHFLFGEEKALFFFTADNRVDFRELIKDLAGTLKMRIELRQIGSRDETKTLGALAVCGNDFCCHRMANNICSVSIKMAKEQDLSLNSSKISGPCGKLLCCLEYEYDYYSSEKKTYPSAGTKFKIGNDFYHVKNSDVIGQKITLLGEEGEYLTVPRSEIYYNENTNHWEISKEYLTTIIGN